MQHRAAVRPDPGNRSELLRTGRVDFQSAQRGQLWPEGSSLWSSRLTSAPLSLSPPFRVPTGLACRSTLSALPDPATSPHISCLYCLLGPKSLFFQMAASIHSEQLRPPGGSGNKALCSVCASLARWGRELPHFTEGWRAQPGCAGA